jgi:hypothetical protein
MTRYQPRRRKSNTIARLFIGFGLFLLLSGTTVIIFRSTLIEYAVMSVLTDEGFSPQDIRITQADLSGLVIGSGSLGDGAITFSTIEITYTPSSLLDAKILELNLVGLSVKGKWDETGITFGSIETQSSGRGQSSDPITPATGTDTTFPFESITIAGMVIKLELPSGLIALNLNSRLDAKAGALATKGDIEIVGPDLSGEARWQGDLRPENYLMSSLSGTINLKATEFLIPGVNDTYTADLNLMVTSEDGALSIDTDREILLSGPWPGTLALANGDQAFTPQFNIALSKSSENAAFVRLSTLETSIRGEIDFNIGLTTPFGKGTLESLGWATFGKDGLPRDFKFERLNIHIEDAISPFGALDATVTADGLKGPLALTEGPVSFSGRIKDGIFTNGTFSELAIDTQTTFRLDGLSLAFALDTLTTQIDNLIYDDLVTGTGPIRIVLAPGIGATQTANIVFGADGSATSTFDTVLQINVPEANLDLNNSSLLLSTKLPSLWLEGYWVPDDDVLEAQIKVQGGALKSDLGSLSNINLNMVGDLSDFEGQFKAIAKMGPLKAGKKEGLALEGTLTGNNNTIITQIVSSISSGDILSEFTASYDKTSQTGVSRALIGPLAFGGQNISASDIRPLGLPFTPTSGELAAVLNLAWGDTPPTTESSTIYLKDIEVEAGTYRVQGLNSAITLKTLWPPKTEGPQAVSVGLLDPGLPMTNVLASFSIEDPSVVKVQNISMTFADGDISGESVLLALDDRESTATLTVSDIALPTLAQLSGLAGLETTGTLSGTIPVRLVGGEVFVVDGTLSTTEPGSIRYRPDQTTSALTTGENGMTLAMKALENFQYESISVQVSGSIQNELEAKLAIKGRNPGLYGGYPIDFNLNLSGELANIIRDGTVGYRVPETIKQQLMNFPGTQ